jgi:hypothetical protein
MLDESVRLSDGSLASRFGEFIFGAILYLLPGLQTFAENDVFFEKIDMLPAIALQFSSTLVYALFLVAVCLIDFYRKEFNL